MNTNDNKALYVARPKTKKDDPPADNVDRLLANRAKGAAFVAYPSGNKQIKSNKATFEVELQEGLFISYPKKTFNAKETMQSRRSGRQKRTLVNNVIASYLLPMMSYKLS